MADAKPPAKPERGRGRGSPVPVAQNIGPIVRERREAMGITLAEAEVATRIRQKYLAALEADEWDLLPGEVVGRGFLRNYSTYLGLDPNEMIERRRAVADESLAAVLVSTSAGTRLPPERTVDYRPKDVPLKEETSELEEPRRLNLAPFFFILLASGVIFLGWLGLTQFGPQLGEAARGAQDQVAALITSMNQPPPTPTLAPTATTSVGPAAGAAAGAAVAAGAAAAAPTVETEPTVAPTPTPVPPTPVPTEAPSIVLALPTPTSTPEVVAPPPAPATTNTDANLRGGPGTDFPVLRGAPTGSTLNIVGRSAAGDWFVLDDGVWVFAQLVDNPPANLPVVEAPAAPAPVEAAPAEAAPAEQPPAQP
jgi:cytoskeletal protein RodZ